MAIYYLRGDQDYTGWGLHLWGDVAQETQWRAPATAYVRPFDAFNWGYDPFHYTVPEGSYAVEADGAARIREFRAMILALAGLDLRVALDVVYNHTNGTGLGSTSVLDKVVPGYYHRTNPESGFVEQSTCAPILPPSIG